MKLEDVPTVNLINGMRKAYDNAEAMLKEARILEVNEQWSRAYTLCQIAIEELGKVPMLFGLWIDRINENSIDYKKLNVDFKDHTEKSIMSANTEIAFFKLYKEQRGGEWVDEAIEKGERYIEKVKELNDLKNESLYVSIKENNFQAPDEIIDVKLYNSIRGIAALRKFMFKRIIELVEEDINGIAQIIKSQEN